MMSSFCCCLLPKPASHFGPGSDVTRGTFACDGDHNVAQPLLAVRFCRSHHGSRTCWNLQESHSQEWLCCTTLLLRRRLRLVHHVFLKLLHLGIRAQRFAHGRSEE